MKFIKIKFRSRIFLFLLLAVGFCNCHNKQKQNQFPSSHPPDPASAPPPAPHPSAEEFCDSLRARTYADLRESGIQLVTDDFPKIGSIDRRILFEKLLKRKFKMKLLPVFDSVYYPRCIMPIMDSAIASKYGKNGKDSIIMLLNKEVYRVYNDW